LGKFLIALIVLLIGSALFASFRKIRGGKFFDRGPDDPGSLKELAERNISEKSNRRSH
jgi:hypothetical protein